VTLRYKRFHLTGRHAEKMLAKVIRQKQTWTNLESHEKTLAFNVRETQIHTPRIPIWITISRNMLHLRGYPSDKPIGERLDMCIVKLRQCQHRL